MTRKTPITAAEILNDRVVPFYDEHGILDFGPHFRFGAVFARSTSSTTPRWR
jgi:hypothetical protein